MVESKNVQKKSSDLANQNLPSSRFYHIKEQKPISASLSSPCISFPAKNICGEKKI
jgi:hypothetical protein